MSMASVPHFIADNFLSDDVHKGLLPHTLNVDDFAAGKVVAKGEATYHPDSRKGQLSNDRLGPYLPAFNTALRNALPISASRPAWRNLTLRRSKFAWPHTATETFSARTAIALLAKVEVRCSAIG